MKGFFMWVFSQQTSSGWMQYAKEARGQVTQWLLLPKDTLTLGQKSSQQEPIQNNGDSNLMSYVIQNNQ